MSPPPELTPLYVPILFYIGSLAIPGDASCNDDLNFVEEINQELELDLPSHERVIKR